MRTLYFDCFAGASGNMILGALIASGVNPDQLKTELKKLGVPDFQLEFETVDRSGISATHLLVRIPEEKQHRHLSDIETIIDNSGLSESVKERSAAIFRRLARAEAKVHAIDVDKVHFHEVGALDAIVDVVGACVCFEILGIEKFLCSKINVGSGFVDMAHGKFPVPPPAVVELLGGVPIYSTEIEGELITPTGAAIISSLCSGYGMLPAMLPEQIGYGAGTRTYEKFPNTLRILIGETTDSRIQAKENYIQESLVLLETNIDDSTPQVAGFVMERALETGANDCWITPIQMKKNRPACMISILCGPTLRSKMLDLLYSETSTLGIRETIVHRVSLERETVPVNTRFGIIDVKVGKFNGRVVNSMPEYEQVKKAALEHGVPFVVVREAALDALGNSNSATAK